MGQDIALTKKKIIGDQDIDMAGGRQEQAFIGKYGLWADLPKTCSGELTIWQAWPLQDWQGFNDDPRTLRTQGKVQRYFNAFNNFINTKNKQ